MLTLTWDTDTLFANLRLEVEGMNLKNILGIMPPG